MRYACAHYQSIHPYSLLQVRTLVDTIRSRGLAPDLEKQCLEVLSDNDVDAPTSGGVQKGQGKKGKAGGSGKAGGASRASSQKKGPKKALTAYNFFCQQQRPKVKTPHPLFFFSVNAYICIASLKEFTAPLSSYSSLTNAFWLTHLLLIGFVCMHAWQLTEQGVNNANIMRQMGAMWKELSTQEKKPYEEQRRSDKERYETEVAELSSKEPESVPVQKKKRKQMPTLNLTDDDMSQEDEEDEFAGEWEGTGEEEEEDEDATLRAMEEGEEKMDECGLDVDEHQEEEESEEEEETREFQVEALVKKRTRGGKVSLCLNLIYPQNQPV
jgi:hypothetical protein